MQAKIQKWGNSLALRIPESFALNIGISQDEVVDLTIDEGKLLVTPIQKKEYSLEELLDGVTEKNIHSEIDTGHPTGREIW